MADAMDGARRGRAADRRLVFLSYRSPDNQPPPEKPRAKGFVAYFRSQLAWELSNLGLPQSSAVWFDKADLKIGDEFTQAIANALAESEVFLAVLSRNYVRDGWCERELQAFLQNLRGLSEEERRRRIFRVDKHGVSEDELPESLRNLHVAQFYEEDPDSGEEREFYWRGRVQQSRLFNAAIRKLAVNIYNRICELNGLPSRAAGTEPELPEPGPQAQRRVQPNGRRIFVAFPGPDVANDYQSLVLELEGRGYTVLTADERKLASAGEIFLADLEAKLAEAELSIHLVGRSKGLKPAGVGQRIVPLQLAEAAKAAARRGRFERLIWVQRQPGEGTADPLARVRELDQLLPTDQVVADTPAHFGQFVLQHLEEAARPAPRPRAASRKATVWLAALTADRELLKTAMRALQPLDVKLMPALLGSEPRNRQAAEALLRGSDHAIFCWGKAEEAEVMEAMASPAMLDWQAGRPGAHAVLACFGPHDESKQMACELSVFASADVVVDCEAAGWSARLAPLLVAGERD